MGSRAGNTQNWNHRAMVAVMGQKSGLGVWVKGGPPPGKTCLGLLSPSCPLHLSRPSSFLTPALCSSLIGPTPPQKALPSTNLPFKAWKLLPLPGRTACQVDQELTRQMPLQVPGFGGGSLEAPPQMAVMPET